MKKDKNIPLITVNTWVVVIAIMLFSLMPISAKADNRIINRIATFPVYLNTDIDSETVAEIVDSSKDGHILVYTDSQTG